MKKVKIHIANAEDWVAVYFDGRAVYQGHSVEGDTMLDLLRLEYTDQWVDDNLDRWGNRFPLRQADLKEQL